MSEKLIPATQLAEYVYCSQAWYLKQHGVQVSKETRAIQAEANAWHETQGRSLATGDSYRWAAYAAVLLAVVLFIFCWLGWSRMSIVLMLASTLVFLGVLLFFLAHRARSKTGIPAGEIFYQDLIGQPFQAEVLRSAQWGISGKPDCLIRTPEGVVPVELKKSKRPPARGEVYPNHSVPYGLVIYAGQQVRRVEYTEASRRWLAQVIDLVRRARTLPAVMRNHRISGRCSGCGLRPHCDQSLI